jgi:hypothetical protein
VETLGLTPKVRRVTLSAFRIAERLGMSVDDVMDRTPIYRFRQWAVLSHLDGDVRASVTRKDLPLPYEQAFDQVFFPKRRRKSLHS